MKHSLTIKKADIAVITVILLAAAAVFAVSEKKADCTAEIIVDGQLIKTVELWKNNETLTIDAGNGVIIKAENNEIFFFESDCSGKNCIGSGRLSSPGDTAVCIPNKTIIKLTGNKNGLPDAVSY